MAYVKLDTGVLDSTLWIDRDAREVFITALLMAEPHEVMEPSPAIEVRTLDPSGFVVPAGWYGLVRAAGVGIVRRAGIDQEAGMAALERLASPEAESRTPDHGGRRLVRVDGGYLVLNFMRYRDRDQTAAERQQRYRDRQKQRNAVTGGSNGVTSRNVTQEEEEAVGSKQDEKEEDESSSSSVLAHLNSDRQTTAYLAFRKAHRDPPALDAAIREQAEKSGWGAVGVALADLHAAGTTFTVRRLAGFSGKAKAHEPPAPRATGYQPPPRFCDHCESVMGPPPDGGRVTQIHAPDCPTLRAS